ncbi:chaperonin 10-like protein [Cladochytrium replicatum]|nr:chaperonin 10-like protein [Cladochytrium replicatum]
MLAVTFHGKQTLKVENVPLPSLVDPTDAIVRTTIVGICGSDLHTYHEREQGCDHGTIMGHEFVGIVHSVGSAVQNLRPGDRVASAFTTNCGKCSYCLMGLTARCDHSQLFGWRSNSQGLHGAQAEYVRVPFADGTLAKVAENISDEEALLAGDIASTGYYCAERGDLQNAKVIAVVGAGPVGLLATAAARFLAGKQAKIVVFDRVKDRLDAAKDFGADEGLSIDEEDPVAAIRTRSNGYGADVVLEVVGLTSASRLAYDLVRPGGTISSVGAHTEPTFGFGPADAYNKNLTYRIGRCPSRHYMDILLPKLPEMRSVGLDITKVISHRQHLSEAVEWYTRFDQKLDGTIKVVLTPNPVTKK